MKLILTIIIAIMQALIVVIPLKGELNKRNKLFLVACCIITVICTVWFFRITDKEATESANLLTNELRVRDSINETKLEERDSIHAKRIVDAGKEYISELDSSDKNTIEALAKYGLKYDTIQRRIEKLIQDSAKTRVIMPHDPVFIIESDGVSIIDTIKGFIKFKIEYKSSDAGSTNFDIKRYMVVSDTFMELLEVYDLPNDISMTKDEVDIGYFSIPEKTKFNKVFIYLQGKYQNLDMSKTYPIDVLCYYNNDTKITQKLTGVTKTHIINFINSKK